jgi:transposase
MPKALSGDLRERVIEAVEAGASRREAAERFEISASAAVKWLQRWRDDGVCAPKPRGGSRSVLEAYAERILALVAEQPDRTLDEIAAAMRKRRIPGSRSALWRFLDRHGITFKKKACGQPSSTERTWRERGGAGSGSRAFLIRRDWCLSMRLRPASIWSVSGDVACVASD